MKIKLLGVVALAACAARADVDLNGSWSFRFEEGKAIEETAGPSFAATDTMSVPGCYDMMPQWFLRRGTGLYRRTFTLERPVANAWLVVDGMGLRVNFQIDGKDLGTHPYPYARLEVETGPLAAGEHTIYAALDNRFDWKTTKLARQYYDFYFYGGFYHGVKLVFDNRKLFVRTRDYKTGTVEIEAVNFKEGDFDGTLVFDGKNEVKTTFRNFRTTVKVPDFKLWSPDSPNLHTVALCSQPLNPSTSQPLNPSTSQPLNPSTSQPLRLLYLGAMGKSYDLETVIDAVKETDDAELDLAGTGPKEAALRARAADCPRIRFHGYLDAAALQDLFARAHAGVIPMFSDSCVGVPNKLADYAAAGLRVVNSLPGETADLISRFAAGTFYTAGDVASFKSALADLRRPAPDFAPAAFRDAFDARRLYAAYVDFIQTLPQKP